MRFPVLATGPEYFLGPLLVLVLVGLLVGLLRWAFSRGGSLVRRNPHSPAPPDTFGLLTGVHTTKEYADARRAVARLTEARIKATAAHTTDGWTVYVWPADESAARALLEHT